MFKQYKLYNDLSNADYHKKHSIKDHYFSSSQLKEMLKDPRFFITKNIHRKLEDDKRNPAFDIGTYFHTALLEPWNLESECAVWRQGRRSGKAWQTFAETHAGKAIITLPELAQANTLIKGVEANDVAWDLIDHPDAISEQSLFGEMFGIRTKVRFDTLKLGKDESYIADLKSTTGSVESEHEIRQKISNYSYDLSMAMYIDMINDYIDENELPYAHVKSFYLIFASKSYESCKVWEGSRGTLAVGRAKYEKALDMIERFRNLDWKIPDEIGIVEPQPWDVSDWIKEKK